MSYKYKDEIKMSLEHFNAGRRVMDGGIYAFESKLSELDHVYTQATKADEYEAKAKAFDEISKLRRKTIGRVRTVGLLAKFGVATWNVINKHERGEAK